MPMASRRKTLAVGQLQRTAKPLKFFPLNILPHTVSPFKYFNNYLQLLITKFVHTNSPFMTNDLVQVNKLGRK